MEGNTSVKEPMVSVVVPVYNLEKYIVQCAESILTSSGKVEMEVILVNDGSTDQTAEKLERLQQEHLPFNVNIIHQQNAGVSAARNTGLRAAKGKYVCFVDADDYVEKEYVQRLMIHANAFPDTVIKLGFFHENIQGVPVDKEEYGGEGFYSIDEIDIS